jgi:DMSO/TMAO reductase YedYZ molybdopterin-dependent catalytic subunit
MPPVSRGFQRRRAAEADPSRIPPGQYVTEDLRVLSAEPTPRTSLPHGSLTINEEVDVPRQRAWDEFLALPSETFTVDIHCVTKWSTRDTTWRGVPVEAVLAGLDSAGEFVTAWCDGGYTTNLPLEALVDGRAWVAYEYGGEPLAPEHVGPARLLVSHLYFWKSAKWLRGPTLSADDAPGFWETYGYHNYGDPWQEQRNWGD